MTPNDANSWYPGRLCGHARLGHHATARWSEAWWTVAGALAMLACGFVSPRQAIETTLAGKDALLFLLSLLLLSLLVGESGFFEWAAIRSARLAKGNARSLYRNAFVLGAVVTAALSLDTSAVMLTPIVLAFELRTGPGFASLPSTWNSRRDPAGPAVACTQPARGALARSPWRELEYPPSARGRLCDR